MNSERSGEWYPRLFRAVHLLVTVLLVIPALDWPSPAAAHPQETPTDVTAPEVGTSADAIRARIKQLEAAGTDEASGKLLGVLRQIGETLDNAERYRERTLTFRQALEADPRETARIREELESPERKASDPAALTASTADEVQQSVKALQGELTARLRPRLTDLEKRLSIERGRPDEVRVQLEAARSKLEELEGLLGQQPEPSADAPESERAQRWLLEARRLARWREIQMLESEQLAQPGRVALLEAQRDQAANEVQRGEERLGRLEDRESELRRAEAERAREQAELLRREAVGKHPLVERAATETAAITREAESLGPLIDRARSERAAREDALGRMQASLEETKRSVELGISATLGAILLEQRRSLPDLREYRKATAERASTIAQVRLRLFQIDRELRPLRDVPRRVDQLVAEASRPADSEVAELKVELERVLRVKQDNLQRLRERYRDDYLPELGRLDTSERSLIAVVEEHAAIFDERLLWIRNAVPIGTDTLRGLLVDARWFLSPANWVETVRAIRGDVGVRPELYIAGGLFLVLPLLLGRRVRRRLDEISGRVGKVRQDGIMISVEALVVEGILQIPLPGALLFLGWRLIDAEAATEFSKAVGSGFVVASGVAFTVSWSQALLRPQGVTEVHFGWNRGGGRVLRKNLHWFGAVALGGSFLIATTQWQIDPVYRHSLGRLVFVAVMLATSVFAFMLLHPVRGLQPAGALGSGAGWIERSQPLWRVLAALVPFSLAILAVTGFYYAALQLEYRLNKTVLLLLVAAFAFAILYRWLLISQRRLAFKKAQEKRAKLREQSESSEESEDIAAIDLEEIDVAAMTEQTQDLLRMAVASSVLVGLWFVWSDVLPALRVFDSVVLGHYQVVVDGAERLEPVTLSNVGLALLVTLVTITAARNIPGFLEISILQRMPIDAGARYATRTLVLYAIVAAGFTIAFNSVGIGWSSVQWLVAALTVGLGFGLQEIFANFVSGLIILLERPVRVGDTVTVGEISGVVTRIRMRATTITDWNRKELVVPNKNFITGELVNWSLSDPILRLDFLVGIAYGSDTALAHRVMLEECRQHPLVLDHPEPNVFFIGFGDNSLNFEVRVFVAETTNVSRTRITHDLHMNIDRACREHDVTIAFPQRDLHLKTAEATLRIEQVGPPPAPPAGESGE